MSECPVKLDSDEACLIAADWHEEHGDAERAERMRAVLTFRFGDRVAVNRSGGEYLLVVGRDAECLNVLTMPDVMTTDKKPVPFPPGGLRRRGRQKLPTALNRWEQADEGLAKRNAYARSFTVGELVRYRRGQTEYLARVIGYSKHDRGGWGVRILPLPGQGQEVSIRSAGPTCVSRVNG